ncbi:hypothetical protein KIW84_031968 [Lathyrus oleraceus]|nr:hypothetical protein KIW84_031968 [Pisum sativum]
MIKMIPILILTIIPNTMLGQSFTLFIKQGITLDRRMGHNFEIPPSSLVTFIVVFMLISIVAYDRVFVPMIRRYTKNPRGITILQRLGIGLMLHVIMMIISCLVERKRLRVARENNLLGLHDKLPLSIFILLPQYALTGIAESFVENSKMDFFYDQAPQSMKSLGTSYTTTSLGLGNFLSTFLLSVVADITRKEGSKGWILDNLNISRLDYYYAFLVALSVLNFLCFLVVSKLYVYNVDVRQNKSCLEMNPADSSLDKSRISQSSRR